MMFLMRRGCLRFSTAGSGRLIFRRCASLRMISRSATSLGMVPGSCASLRMISRSATSLGMVPRNSTPLRTIPRNGTGTPLRTIAGSASSLRMVARSASSLGMVPRSASLGMKPGAASLGMKSGAALGVSALESSIPTSPLAVIVAVIKILVIVRADLVGAPLRILSLKIIPVLGTGLIPRIPPRCIPVLGPDDIDLGIGVIRGKSNFRAEKVIEDPIHEPIAFVKGPGRIGPNIRLHDHRLDRACHVIALGGRRSGHRDDRASSQRDYQQQKNN